MFYIAAIFKLISLNRDLISYEEEQHRISSHLHDLHLHDLSGILLSTTLLLNCFLSV